MAKTKEFIIPFKGLAIGFHEFSFEINKTFFDEIEYSDIENGDLAVNLSFERQENMLVLDFSIQGEIEVSCDRCLDQFRLDVEGQQQLIVQFGESFKEETDEIIILPEHEHEFNIAPYLYEYIYLLKPIQCIHPENEDGESACNTELIEKLDELNNQEKIDPRWDALKKLKNE